MFFPEKKHIQAFVSLIVENEAFLYKLLPSTEEYWINSMAEMVENTRLKVRFGQIKDDEVLKFASCLFMKIIMNHRMVDGNKRSGVIMLYLFLFLNSSDLGNMTNSDPEIFRYIAKKIVTLVDSYPDAYEDAEKLIFDTFTGLLENPSYLTIDKKSDLI